MIFKNKKAFTLIELLVIITMISILALIGTNSNFNTISDNQRNNNFAIKIKSAIDTVKSNALVGKGIGVNLDTPEKWKISFSGSTDINSPTGRGLTTISYYSGSTWNTYETIKGEGFEEIKSIICSNIDKTSTGADNIGEIIIEGNLFSLSGATCGTSPHDKIIEITTGYKQFSKKFEFNVVNGVLTDIKN